MSGFIKVKAKELLLKNTFKLFFISFTSALIRILTIISFFAVFHFSLVSSFMQNLVHTYNSLLVYFIFSLTIVTLFLISLLTVSAIKLGENAIYFMESRNQKSKFKYLFIFLRPSQSFRALYFYTRLFLLKSLWYLFFNIAPIFTLLITLHSYVYSTVFTAVFITLIFGTIILFSVSRYFCNVISVRYSFATFYLCTDLKITVKDAIEKSNEFSDGFLKDGVALKSSFFPWFLTCLIIFPFIYVIPYFKLSKAKFITFSNALHYSLPQPDFNTLEKIKIIKKREF